MKSFVAVLLMLASLACAENVQQVTGNTAYGYLANIGIPEGERIRKAEEAYLSQSRIIGGTPAEVGQYVYQAGLLLSIVGFEGSGICGGSLISASRVITAAHCWNDGVHQAWRVTTVLGSTMLFSGGIRIDSSAIAVHPNWIPVLARNDIGVIYLPSAVTFSSAIGPVSLPTGSELLEDFADSIAVASGFGLTSDDGSISQLQVLSHVNLNVIANSVCSPAFPLILQPSNLCTSGIGGVGTCSGDSGGPLVVIREDRHILIGVTSFGSALGCESFLPAAFARVTSFMDFLNQHIA